MTTTIETISLFRLSLSFLPVVLVLAMLYFWALNYRESTYAFLRMLGQLAVIGYFLAFLFESDHPAPILFVLTLMVLAASWISLRTIPEQRRSFYGRALLAILLGGGLTLALISQGVLHLSPWYFPRYLIPLAGMIFANSMNSISLAAERLWAELQRGEDFHTSRGIAFKASLIPITNALFAVGLVSIPGMMTGQILSGVSPLLAARYQVMVMCMVFGASGISAGLFLVLIESEAKSLFPEKTASG